MPKSDKVVKKVKKEKAIHPNSRKAAAINREQVKVAVREHRKVERTQKEAHLWEKVNITSTICAFFLKPSTNCC